MDDGLGEEKEQTYVWRVLAVNETVTVPAGTFTNAIRIERDRPDKEGKLRTYWLVPGIGKVKETASGSRSSSLTTSRSSPLTEGTSVRALLHLPAGLEAGPPVNILSLRVPGFSGPEALCTLRRYQRLAPWPWRSL